MAHTDARRQNGLDPAPVDHRDLAAEPFDRAAEGAAGALALRAQVQFEEATVGAALLGQVAVGGDLAPVEDQHLLAALLYVAQQVRRDNDPRLARIPDLADQPQHPETRRRVETVRRFVQKQEARPVGDRLRQLEQLLHAQRIGLDVAVARLAQTDVEEDLVRALESRLGRQPRKLRHQPHETHAGDAGDEGVPLGHVADPPPEFPALGRDVHVEQAGGSRGWLVEAEQGVQERRLAGAVRPQQTDRPAREGASQLVQDLVPAESDAQTVEVDHGRRGGFLRQAAGLRTAFRGAGRISAT